MAFPLLALLPMVGKIVAPLLGKLFDVVDKVVPDKDLARKLKAQMQMTAMAMDHTEFLTALKEQASIIRAEYTHGNMLSRSWRPIVMLFFTFLIGSYWYGFVPENVDAEMTKYLLGIIKLGLGGYVVGRSVEKIVDRYKK